MKRKLKPRDLDYANHVAEMEEAIKKIEGVSGTTVSFMTQRMTIEANDSGFDEIMKEVVSVCGEVEPSYVILP